MTNEATATALLAPAPEELTPEQIKALPLWGSGLFRKVYRSSCERYVYKVARYAHEQRREFDNANRIRGIVPEWCVIPRIWYTPGSLILVMECVPDNSADLSKHENPYDYCNCERVGALVAGKCWAIRAKEIEAWFEIGDLHEGNVRVGDGKITLLDMGW